MKTGPFRADEIIAYQISKWNPKRAGKGRKGAENQFQDLIIKNIDKLSASLGFPPTVATSKEFNLFAGRIDIFTFHEDGSYAIWETKVGNDKRSDDMLFAFAIGQLLAYDVSFRLQHKISKERIHLVLIVSKVCSMPHQVIGNWGLPIDIIEVGENEMKAIKYAK